MAISVKVNTVDKSSYVMSRSIRISDVLNERSTASLTFLDTDGSYRPSVGDVVEIYDGTTLLFAGSIDDLPEEKIVGSDALRYANVNLVDYHSIADRRIIADAYESHSAGAIVNHLITDYLDDDGITAGDITTGPIITKAVFNYLTASQCLDELSELTGYQWRINPDKSLDFFERSTYTGTAITSSSAIGNVRVRKGREQYRNRQYIRAGQDISSSQTRTFKGDGETQVWPLDLPCALKPTITVGGVAKTVGIRNLETGFDFYWSKGEKEISQDSGGTKLAASDILSVAYQGYYPIIVVAEDPAQITERKTAEGGTGWYESIDEKISLDTRESALEWANGLLRRYARIMTELTFNTYLSYSPGQLVDVNLSDHSLSETMLVSKVDISEIGAYDGRLKRSVTLISGESFGGWVKFFKAMSEKNMTFVIRENEVLIKLLTMTDDVTLLKLSEPAFSATIHQYLVCATGQYCGTEVII